MVIWGLNDRGFLLVGGYFLLKFYVVCLFELEIFVIVFFDFVIYFLFVLILLCVFWNW